MPSKLRIKRSTGSTAPTTTDLVQGELGYSEGAGRLYVGVGGSDTASTSVVQIAAANLFASQTAGTVYAAPQGSAGVPTFRQLAASDITSGTLNHARLPIAASNTLGAIRRGGGLDIAPDGTLSVSPYLQAYGVEANYLTIVNSIGSAYFGINNDLDPPVEGIWTGFFFWNLWSGEMNTGAITASSINASALPLASSSTRGAVRIGSGVNIDANGVISVSTNYAAASHTHSASDITSGTLNAARLPASVVQQSASGDIALTIQDGGPVPADFPIIDIYESTNQAGRIAAIFADGGASFLGAVQAGSISTAGISFYGGGYQDTAWTGWSSAPSATTSTRGFVSISTGLNVASGAVSVAYGTTSGTSCQGNDARLSDARTPTGAAGGVDLTGTYPDPTLTTTGVTAAPYGSASSVATFTVDAKGRLTAAGSTAIAISSSAVSGLGSLATLSSVGESNLANAVRNTLFHPFLLGGM